MRAVILAAGAGRRLGVDRPKCLLEFGGKSLLERHLERLAECGIERVAIALGYRAAAIEAVLAARPGPPRVETVYNPDFESGSLLSLWSVRAQCRAGEDLLLMDADVLYDARLLQRLVDSRHGNCFLLDRDFEPGEEPVKLCLRRGRFVEFRKRVEVDFDECGESVGFFRFSAPVAAKLLDAAGAYVAAGRLDEPHEEAIRDLLLAEPEAFGYEDVTGLPWIEIDFPEDVARARARILPQLRAFERRP